MAHSHLTPAGTTPSRVRLAEVIVRRPRVNLALGLLLALAFALVVAPIVMAESWLVDAHVVAGEPAPATVRVKTFDGHHDGVIVGTGGSVVLAAGERATAEQALLAEAAGRSQPRGAGAFAAFVAVLFVLAAGVTHHLRRSNRGRLLRVQLVLLGSVAAGAAVTKILLLMFPVSVLAVPVALGAVVPTLAFDRTVGLAGGVLAAVVMSLLVPFDAGVTAVLVVQAVAAAIVLPERPRARLSLALASGATATAAAALTYLAFSYLSSGVVPTAELAEPLRSSWVAAAVGGAMAGVLALVLLPPFQIACGEITHATLVALEDLSHPLLRQIAEKSPGTWQHSLAMANLAEIAANSIGASGRLVRVGAYFHDLGKSLQPTYFIENLGAGEPSPHDRLAPEVSCDAIFAHVTEGLALARRMKLPERIVDFMHMHHGDGVLEYFWAKCQETGNPRRLTIEDFRYPGVPPQSRETAILAICDAVEAASRTLKRPDARSIENLVQRIVYGKLHLGQLDESGLSMRDLRRINDSLRETIRHAHHGRIEYPWQREAAAEEAARNATAPTVVERAPTATQRLMHEPRLDSLDVPRPMQWEDPGRSQPGLQTPTPKVTADTQPTMAGTGTPAVLAVGLPAGLVTGTAETMPMTAPAAAEPVAAAPVPAPTVVETVSLRREPALVVDEPVRAPALVVDEPAGDPATTVEDPVTEPGVVYDLGEPPPMPEAPPAEPDPVDPVLEAATAAFLGHSGAFEPALPALPRANGARSTASSLPAAPAPVTPPPASDAAEVASPAPVGTDAPASALDAPPLIAAAPPTVALAPVAVDPAPAVSSAQTDSEAPADQPDGARPPAESAIVDASRSAWADKLASRLDTMLEEADADSEVDDGFASLASRRTPPPPPPRRVPTHEIEADEVEASIELSPHARIEPTGPAGGPPPNTRPGRTTTQADVATIAAADDDGPTVVRKPASSMLPPRVRPKPE